MVHRLCLVGSCLWFVACGNDIQQKGFDEPCTRTEQCEEGLACLAGVCLFDEDAEATEVADPGR